MSTMSGSDNAENLAWQANKSPSECHRYISAVVPYITNANNYYVGFNQLLCLVLLIFPIFTFVRTNISLMPYGYCSYEELFSAILFSLSSNDQFFCLLLSLRYLPNIMLIVTVRMLRDTVFCCAGLCWTMSLPVTSSLPSD